MLPLISKSVPFLLKTILCVVLVEGFYLTVEHYWLNAKAIGSVGPHIQEKQVIQTSDDQKVTEVDYSIILTRNLFGLPPKEKKKELQPISTEELEKSTLDVVLMGTIDGASEDSRAIILAKKNKKQSIYKVGDHVQDAVIKEILRGKVVLHSKGIDEVLDMSEAKKYAPQVARAPVPRASPSKRGKKVFSSPPRARAVQRREGSGNRPPSRPIRRIVSSRDAHAQAEAEIQPQGVELPAIQ